MRANRLRPGDHLLLTDGAGELWRARLDSSDDAEATCTLVGREEPPPALPVEIGFGIAAKSRTLWLVEKAVELGAVGLQPVEFHRSTSVADAGRSRSFWEKAHRRAISALKQCGGARLPEIGPVRDLHEYVGRDRRAAPGELVARDGPDLLLDPEGAESLLEALEGWDGRPPLRILLGPEGGLAEGEREAAVEAGFRPVRLGPRTLRFETAAVAALAVAGAWLAAGRSSRSEELSHG